MRKEHLYSNGSPFLPNSSYDEDNAAEKIRQAQEDIEAIKGTMETELLHNEDIADWAKAAVKPTYTANEVGADASGSAADVSEETKAYTDSALAAAREYADSTYTQAAGYTDQKIADLIGGAPKTLDTLKEIADAMAENDNVVDALDQAISSKAAEVEFQAHQANKTIHTTNSEKRNWNAAKEKIDKINTGYGTCSTAADVAEKEVVLEDNPNWELKTGSEVVVKFSYTNTAQNPTLNVNGTGAKSVYWNTSVITTSGLGYVGTANRYIKYVYNGTQYVFMGWSIDMYTTYTPASLGGGYGTCSTAAATVAKVATLSGYSLVTGGAVSIKFTNDVPAGATLNINSKGAKAIYYRGAAITAGVIKAGDIATFRYSGQYHLLGVDRDNNTTYGTGTESKSGITKLYAGTGENADGAMTQAAVSALLEEMQANFQDGCSVLAAMLTACGVATANNASPDTMAANIREIYENRYNAGAAAAKIGTASAGDVLSGKTFTNAEGTGIAGTMPDNGAVSGSIGTSGGSYIIPKGYHNGNGKITGPALAALIGTNVNLANAANLLAGITAYGKNGTKYTGTMANRGAVTQALNCGGSYTIPAGYHNGNGKITANALSGQTAANAVAANLTKDKTAWVNGVKITGTGADNTTNYNNGYSAGRTQGQNDVKNSPNSYSLYTKTQYDANYSSGYNAGVTAADNRANANSANYKAGYNAGYNAGVAAGKSQGATFSQTDAFQYTSKDGTYMIFDIRSRCANYARLVYGKSLFMNPTQVYANVLNTINNTPVTYNAAEGKVYVKYGTGQSSIVAASFFYNPNA